MKNATSRPVGRFFYWPIVIALIALCAAQSGLAATPVKTVVQDTVYRADGNIAQGTLLISWPGFTSANGDPVAAGSLSVKIGADGKIAIGLVPNTGSTPSSSYKVTLRMNDGVTSEEYWTVPATSSTTIGAIRSKVVPASVAQQFVGRDYVDTKMASITSTSSPNTFTAPQTDSAVHTFQAGITGTGTIGSLTLGSSALTVPNAWSGAQTFQAGITGAGTIGSLMLGAASLGASNTWSGTQMFNGGIASASINAVQVVGQGGNTTVQAAVNALPATGGTIEIPAGTFACGITITKPVRLVGSASGGFNDNVTYTTFVAGTILQNTSTNGDCITVSLPASNSLGGVTLENIWIQGNRNVVGATGGDNLVIAGGNAANKNLRHVVIRNVLSTDAKGNNLTIKDNAYMLSVYDSQFYRAAGHGIGVLASGAGMPSQIGFYSVTSDANTGDALNINGAAVHDIHGFRSTFADSLNGVNVAAGSTNATFTCTGCNFESNTNAGVLLKDGYAHNVQDSSFSSDGIQKYGVYLDPPSGANFVNQQLFLSNNTFGANTTKDVFISANAHVATIWPNSPSNYTYQDLSGGAQQVSGKVAETDFSGTVKVGAALGVGGGALLLSTNQSGTGSICMTANCVMTTPSLGAASATSLSASGTVSGGSLTTTGAMTAASLTASAQVSSATSLTATNCASSAGTCGSAAAGRVTIAASATTVTVATTAVTANSEIFIQEDRSMGTALGVTCNSTSGRSYIVTSRTAGTNFVITASASPATNPACLSYRIVN